MCAKQAAGGLDSGLGASGRRTGEYAAHIKTDVGNKKSMKRVS